MGNGTFDTPEATALLVLAALGALLFMGKVFATVNVSAGTR